MKLSKYNSTKHCTKRDKIFVLHVDAKRFDSLSNPSSEELDKLFQNAQNLQIKFPQSVVRIVEVHLSGFNHFFKTPLF